MKRFARLWHWSRELSNSTQYKSSEELDDMNECFNFSTHSSLIKLNKTFERSLLIILDVFSDSSTPAPLIKLIQEWLMSLICDYNDLPRILDILLVSLLHPNTARVSVQHFIANLLASSSSTAIATPFFDEETEHEANDDYESKVYAISNEGGNVKYHVNEASKNTTSSSNQQLMLVTMLTSPENSTNSAASTSSASKPLRNSNVELPLSILNAATLNNQGKLSWLSHRECLQLIYWTYFCISF